MSVRTSSARYWVPAALAIAALALTGCSGDSGKAESGAAYEEGPLGKYMSALWDDEAMTQEKFDAENLKTEELVAACMTKEGFEYEPNTNSGGVVTMSEEDSEGPEWNSEEFAKEYGYGIVDFPGGGAMAGPDDEYVDPNQKYIDSLSESEQAAFYETLHGPGPTEEEMAAMEEGGSFTSDWTREGCYGAARHETQQDSPGGMAAYEDPEFAELFESMNAVYETVYSEDKLNPEIEQTNRDWSDCMAEAGYPDLTDPMTAQNGLSEEYYASQGMGEDGGEIKEPTQKEKDAFQEREIEMATADFTCKKELKYEEKQQKVLFAAEQKFVDENKAALDALIAKHGVKKKD
ncbi:hypothetical protein FM113_15650 [Leucobacter sp. 7(1)]|uniref:hypothetical protein n=1 Tax=Leucobacter sp. 7(1) TaxID=1255613 RepID=UPI00097E8BCB|nr:hypothetical protein [Leucobacter sp. 7(1)]SJN12715.1 hypothetical protein FM113_15650 [Leucobacter sp. 7(1)]